MPTTLPHALHVSCARCGFTKYSPSDEHMMKNREPFNIPLPETLKDCLKHRDIRIFDLYRGYNIDSVFVFTNVAGDVTHFYGVKHCYGCRKFDNDEKLNMLRLGPSDTADYTRPLDMELMRCNDLAYISLCRVHYKNYVPGGVYKGGQPQIHSDCGKVYSHGYKHYITLT